MAQKSTTRTQGTKRRKTPTKSRVGRYTHPHESGKHTPPIPKAVRHSAWWYGYVVLAFLVIGVVVIVLNYAGLLPGIHHGDSSAWYLITGLVVISVGFILACRYH